MQYKLVIFDFDGTLADSFPWFSQVFNSVADRYNFRRVEASELELLRGYGARELIQHLGVPLWKIPLIARHVRGLAADNVGHVSLFAGVDQMLRRLSEAGVTLAVATSNSYPNVRDVLGAENVARITYFECGASLFGKSQHFRRILRAAGVAPAETLSIGDEIRDIDAAQKAGIPFAAVAWGFTSADALKARGPAHMFERVDDIASALTGARAEATETNMTPGPL